MKNALARALLTGLAMIAVAIGCASSVIDPDSETHWLRVCGANADCGNGLSCVCNGTCTKRPAVLPIPVAAWARAPGVSPHRPRPRL